MIGSLRTDWKTRLKRARYRSVNPFANANEVSVFPHGCLHLLAISQSANRLHFFILKLSPCFSGIGDYVFLYSPQRPPEPFFVQVELLVLWADWVAKNLVCRRITIFPVVISLLYFIIIFFTPVAHTVTLNLTCTLCTHLVQMKRGHLCSFCQSFHSTEQSHLKPQ